MQPRRERDHHRRGTDGEVAQGAETVGGGRLRDEADTAIGANRIARRMAVMTTQRRFGARKERLGQIALIGSDDGDGAHPDRQEAIAF